MPWSETELAFFQIYNEKSKDEISVKKQIRHTAYHKVFIIKYLLKSILVCLLVIAI